MKLEIKMLLSGVLGALLVFVVMSNVGTSMDFIQKVNASEIKAASINGEPLKSCEVFFKDDRDAFEEEINSRLKNVKLLQSNVLWSETTEQFGFYALICC